MVANSTTETPVIRLGAVSYLNTLPLIEGLGAHAGIDLTLAAPSRLLAMLEGGEVDAALAPVIDAMRADREMELIPAGAIGCEGATLTVRLYSTGPFDRVARVHADTESHTSIGLARWALRERYGVEPEFVEFDARERVESAGGAGVEWPEAMLMIGDKVVTDSPPAVRYPHQIDLGEAWRERTGLPFVYAMWMRPADAELDEEKGAALAGALASLDRQRRFNRTRLDWIVSRRAKGRRWPADLAREYLGRRLTYEVGERQVTAVERFFDEAAGLGVIGCDGERPRTRWGSLHRAEAAAGTCRG
jgi:chorismate dehydratase